MYRDRHVTPNTYSHKRTHTHNRFNKTTTQHHRHVTCYYVRGRRDGDGDGERR